ncbi:Uncharacterized protein FWK35_00011396 [Aphis craccivora]|uniref:Uncharacterized protein n=1 Tax=Aphis craccivora TaxID=307492 RepID=A0A6G0Z3P2_APHCR|nr:Uncharacterized protein FWK35_00011396 [Aphis craccivora]
MWLYIFFAQFRNETRSHHTHACNLHGLRMRNRLVCARRFGGRWLLFPYIILETEHSFDLIVVESRGLRRYDLAVPTGNKLQCDVDDRLYTGITRKVDISNNSICRTCTRRRNNVGQGNGVQAHNGMMRRRHCRYATQG